MVAYDEYDIGAFTGADGDTATAFLRRFDMMVRARGWDRDEAMQLLQFVRRLKGKASAWYGRLPQAVAEKWAPLRAEFIRVYDRKPVGASPAMRLRELRQKPSQSVEEYTDAFHEVLRDTGLPVDGELAKDLFVSGLRGDLHAYARAHIDMSLTDLARYVGAIDAEISQKIRRPPAGPWGTSAAAPRPAPVVERGTVPDVKFGACFRCGRPGHIAARCPERPDMIKVKEQQGAQSPVRGAAAPIRPPAGKAVAAVHHSRGF
jgi:hypothetical protein